MESRVRLGKHFASSEIGLPAAKSKLPRIQAAPHHRAGVPALGMDVSYSPDDSVKQAGIGQPLWLLAHKAQTFCSFCQTLWGKLVWRHVFSELFS